MCRCRDLRHRVLPLTMPRSLTLLLPILGGSFWIIMFICLYVYCRRRRRSELIRRPDLTLSHEQHQQEVVHSADLGVRRHHAAAPSAPPEEQQPMMTNVGHNPHLSSDGFPREELPPAYNDLFPDDS